MLSTIMSELEKMGDEQTKKTFLRHGAREPVFGVKVENLKKIQKRVKKNHELALQLFETGNVDAMYLAGLISDPPKMSPENLNRWASQAYTSTISEYAVAWTAAESPHALQVAADWIESDQENVAAAGWGTLIYYVSMTPNPDVHQFDKLLERVARDIKKSANRVRYTMNGFVIAVGSYVPALTEKATEIARRIGKVEVDMHGTACKVPDAESYIDKVKQRGTIGKLRKSPRC
jgi:3-methyladenine DNA glycosylase AlkD